MGGLATRARASPNNATIALPDFIAPMSGNRYKIYRKYIL
jgi:hypothetical protein